MDLGQALAITRCTATFAGRSDRVVAGLAQDGLRRSTAHAVPAFNGGVALRTADVLLHLAYATRLNYERTVLDVYMQWALARYIGAFELAPPLEVHWPGLRTLRLSESGRRVVANQRRVFSEDVGIGLASVLAHRWFGSARPGIDLHLVDIDIAIASGAITAPAGARTDYLVVADDPATGHVLLLGMIEAKGSESRANALRQVTRGAEQVEATTRGGRGVAGLVSVAQSGRDELSYYVASIAPDEPLAEVDLGGGPAARSLLGTSWAKVADFADDPELYERVAPRRLKERRPSSVQRSSARRSQQEVQGAAYEGTEAVVPLPGGDLHVFLGAEERLVTALREGALDRAASIRADLRRSTLDWAVRSEAVDSVDWSARADHVESASADGVALALWAE